MNTELRVMGAGNPAPDPIAPVSAAVAPSEPARGHGRSATPSAPNTGAGGDVLQRAAQRVVESMQQGGNSFKFTFDKQSGMTVVRVLNRATGELVRQIPSEEVVHIAQLLRQDEQRTLLDVKV